jgi:hypothetical protein
MEHASAPEPAIAQAEQRNVERSFKRLLCHLGYRGRSRRRQRALHKPNRLARERRQTPGEARVLEPSHGGRKRLVIRNREIHPIVAERGGGRPQVRRECSALDSRLVGPYLTH